ncbi:unnamed protein product [Sordaria macrospora k-hell]|uniref:WGS project CABT00000000 data, contig 2.11 n=2 Tax=Sordaria macrospora TaxID=5147 RepID=F7VX63_SORMK|nr:uncharacterized protein SMAC_02684 [Sordaria macrospora k-hell]CCC10105.1 unnamed protein product [Sordaria macrospora k-hell]
MEEINPLPANYHQALKLIDEAHAQDPRSVERESGSVPFELDYARHMTRWLALREPGASPVLQLACRAQHFRRWEIPRSSYPMTRPGYLTWRAKLKSQAAKQVAELLGDASIQPPLSQEEIDRVAALVRKEDLKTDSDTQVLEDVACLVFLDEQFDDFEKRPDIDEEKMVGILRKTWGKMSPSGHALALQMHLSERAKILIEKALGV